MGGPIKTRTNTPQAQDVKPLQQNGQTTGADKNYAIGERLSTGDVNPTAEVIETYTNEESYINNSNKTVCGYNIEELRKYLKPYYHDQYDNYDKLSDQEILDLADKTLKEEKIRWEQLVDDAEDGLSAEQKELFNKTFPQGTRIEKAIIEAYFNAGAAIEYIKEIFNEHDISNMAQDDLHDIYRKKCRSCWEFELVGQAQPDEY